MPFLLSIGLNLIIELVLSIGSTLLQQALFPKKQQQAGNTVSGFRGTVQTGGQVPQSFLVGTIGAAGKLEYRNAWGASGGTPNAYLTDVISFGDLAIASATPTAMWVNTQPVTVTTTGHTTQGYPVAEFNSSGDHLWWEGFKGDQTVANSYLTGKFGSDADRPWLSDMIGRQLPLLTVSALVAENLWSGFPAVVAQWQGIKLYDPRQDTTAGGSGSQDWADPSTWTFSDNSIVIVYNILRGIYDGDGNHVWGGSLSAYQLPYAVWAAAMDACDEEVDLEAGGTEKRFRGGREIFLNERPADVITEFLTGANARIAWAGGQCFVLVGLPASADGTFTDADILASESITQTPFPNLDEVINGGTASYMEPSQAWEFKETAPYTVADYVTADDSREQKVNLKLSTTFSGTQAQRVLKATVEEGRRFLRWAVALTPIFATYRPLQRLDWTSAENQYTSKAFLIVARTIDPWGNVFLGLQEIDPADHDWTAATDEKALSFAPLTPVTPAAQDVADFSVAPYTITGTGAVPFKPAIEFLWDGTVSDVRALLYEVRLADDASLVLTGEFATRFSSGAGTTPGGALKSNTAYEARGKYDPFSSRTTSWSSWLSVTTPTVSDADVTDLQVSQLGTELANAYGLVTDPTTGGSIPAQILALQQLAEQLGEAVATVSDTVRQRLDILAVQHGGNAAAIIQNQQAILTEAEARATAITEVVAQFGDSLADGYIKLDAVANTTTGDVSISAKVKAAVGTAVSQAAWILKATVTEDGDDALFAVLGKLHVVVPGGDGTLIPAIETLDDGTVKFSGTRMGRITSLDGLSYIDFPAGGGIDIYSQST